MKPIVISLLVAVAIIGGAFALSRKNTDTGPNTNLNNVTIVDGKQIIEIKAKGGYLPRTTIAKANMPTILRFDTNGTFDCSATVRVPSLNITKTLPNSGSTDIDVGNPKLSTLQGICGMGMYNFQINFT